MALVHVKALLTLDNSGHRVFAKYYRGFQSSRAGQSGFEAQLFSKAQRMGAKPKTTEVTTLDQVTVLFKPVGDVTFFVVADQNENEILMQQLLDCIVEACELLYREELERRTILEAPHWLMIAVDEMIEDGLILTQDPNEIFERSSIGDSSEFSSKRKEGTFERALASARESIAKSFMRG
jgi:hypothetical protein